MSLFSVTGFLADVHQQRIYPATVSVSGGLIVSIKEEKEIPADSLFILPGFTDSHVHIESSMLVPAEFARLAVVHGTVSTISDPHEIANVCGIEGVEFMIDNGKTVPFKFHFGAPSCVPATIFETAGAAIDSTEVEQLLQRDDIYYLSEMMNFPGVLFRDAEVLKKIDAAVRAGKPVDGHAPGLRGEDARKYIAGGREEGLLITTDHECFTAEEALDKLRYGMKILIREGSAARNFEALIPLLADYPDQVMFCSDDKHPDSLVDGHINQLCARAIAKGIPLFNVLKAACLNPVLHYRMRTGLLRPGDAADFILVKDLQQFEVVQTYIDGNCVADNGRSLIGSQASATPNRFFCDPKVPADFLPANAIAPWWKPGADSRISLPVIEVLDGQLITLRSDIVCTEQELQDGRAAENDLLKIAVVNRYQHAPVAIAWIKNVGLREGALASSVAHDSHNIVAVGTDDASICRAVNLVIAEQGGISACSGLQPDGLRREMVLPLPVAGLMCGSDGYDVATAYTRIDAFSKELGATLGSPFMSLSFMALLVIPELKLSDKGLFDGKIFRFL